MNKVRCIIVLLCIILLSSSLDKIKYFFSPDKVTNTQNFFYLKNSWLDGNGCEILDSNFQAIYTFPWDFCIITPEGFLGHKNKAIDYFSYDNKHTWSHDLYLHHDIDYKSEIFTFPDKIVIKENGQSIKVDRISQIHQTGKILFQWSANDHLTEIENLFTKKLKLRYILSEDYFEYTYINSVAQIGQNDRASSSHIFQPNHILISLNLLGLIILDPLSNRIVWSYDYAKIGHGQIHSARVLKNGNILFFLNESLKDGFSQIVELNPLNKNIVWSFRYEKPFSFFTKQFGSVIPSNDTVFLVTHTTSGSAAFEVNKMTNTLLWEKKWDTTDLIYRVGKIPSHYIHNKPFYKIFKNPEK